MTKIHSKNTDLFMGGYEVSAYFGEVSVESSLEEADVTNFASTAKEFLVGHREGALTFSGFFDSATNASDDLLNSGLGSAAGVPTTIVWEGAGTLHNRAIVANLKETSYNPGSAVGSAVTIEAEGRADGGPDYGYILAQHAAQGIGTTTFTGYDWGTDATTGLASNGFAGNLHVTSIVSGSPSLAGKFQDSADNSTYADITGGAFTAIAAVGSQHLTGTASVRRYTRWAYTMSGTGSMVFTAALAKKR